jgi:hypothetical protein
VPIRGYDPRDLLRGHFIQFSLDVREGPVIEPCVGEGCCLCLERAEPVAVLRRASCERARRVCAASFPVGHADGPQRFYVPEARAADLDALVREATASGRAEAELSVDDRGRIHIHRLWAYGRPLD